MKYIMFQQPLGKGKSGMHRKIPVIFPDALVHSEVAMALAHLFPRAEVVSAGFLAIDVLSTSGGSKTLRLQAHEDDEKIINCYDYLHGL